MSTLMWVIMPVGQLLLVGTLPALAATALVRRILALAALGATVGTAAGCTRGAFAARTAATATTATSAASTATRLAIALYTLPVGTAIRTLCVLTFSTCGERRARVNAISDVIRGAIRVSRAIHVAATTDRIRWATCVTGPIALTVVATAVTFAIRVVPIPITAIVAIAPTLATIPLRVVLATATRRPVAATWPAIAVTMPAAAATTAAAL